MLRITPAEAVRKRTSEALTPEPWLIALKRPS
jgi:hypothetical protein